MQTSAKTPAHTAPELLDIEGAAAYLGVNPRWVRRQIGERRLAHFKVGLFVRIAREDLDALLRAGRREAVR